MKKLVLLLCGVVVLGMAAQPAAGSGLGAYIGFALDPDDFIAGVRWYHPLGEENLFLVPSAEVGFGDATMFAGNLDLHYRFKSSSTTKFYAGGGMTVNYFDFDGGSDTEFGGSILGGILLSAMKSGSTPFIEVKLGLGDVPDAKFMVGLNFK